MKLGWRSMIRFYGGKSLSIKRMLIFELRYCFFWWVINFDGEFLLIYWCFVNVVVSGYFCYFLLENIYCGIRDVLFLCVEVFEMDDVIELVLLG